MRAIVCEEFGPPTNLKVKKLDDPFAGPGDVVIRVEATGLGYVDALMAAGLYQIKPPVPYTPGGEIAGVVEQAGEKVKHLRIGQRVLAMPGNGGLAEKMVLPEKACFSIPDALSSDAAASFLVNYCTAYHGLIDCGRLKKGEVVLVLGAAGGVGMAAIDVCRAAGAEVIAAASSKKKRDACLDAGAQDVVNYSKDNWRDELKKVLGDRKLSVVYDPVGGDYAEPAFRSLAPNGRFLVVGFAAGDIPRIPLNLPLLKRASIIGVNWGGHVAENPSSRRTVVTRLLEWIAAAKLRPEAGETFSLRRSGTAMKKMLERKAVGKVVVRNQE